MADSAPDAPELSLDRLRLDGDSSRPAVMDAVQPLESTPHHSALGLIDCELPSTTVDAPRLGSVVGERRFGITKFFNATKGFGFILDHAAEELGGAEVFVHYTAISSVQGGDRAFKALLEGEEVSYFVSQSDKGWQAQLVTGPTGGPCIGSSPPPPPPGVHAYPRKAGSSDLGGFRQTRSSRQPFQVDSHRGRGLTRQTVPGRIPSRETYSNVSSPLSLASSQLPATPHSPYVHSLPPTAVGSPLVYSASTSLAQPVFYGPPAHEAIAYFPPPVLPLAGHYYAAHFDANPTSHPYPVPSPHPSNFMLNRLAPSETQSYPISSGISSYRTHAPLTKSSSTQQPYPYGHPYGGARNELDRPSSAAALLCYGYPISSRTPGDDDQERVIAG